MLNQLKELKYSLAAIVNPPQRTCIVCNRKIYGFKPLSPVYEEMNKKFGSPYSVYDAETINVEEYSCPRCGCSDRDRLYALFFKKALQPSKTNKVLDIAPSASLASFLKKYTNIIYRSADLYMKGVDDKVDLTNMHIYEDNSYDIFICSHVLEHVHDDKKAMQELYRVLKPGGWGIAMVPILLPVKEIDEDPSIVDINERWRRFGQDDHVRVYSKSGYIQRLKEAGFKVQEYTKADFREGDFDNNGINARSVLYIVYK
jgi:predicted SAM-dependent methyltransferase